MSMPLKQRPLQLIFQQLPEEFTKSDILTLLKKHHRTMHPSDVVRKFKNQNLIRPIGYNQFSKLEHLNP